MSVKSDLSLTFSILSCIGLGILFSYLVGHHYPFVGWTLEERIAFIVLFSMAVFFAFAFCACVCLSSESNSTPSSTTEFTSVQRPTTSVNKQQLIELNEIIYPDSEFNFSRLKYGIQKLRSEELEIKLESNKSQLMSFISNLQSKVDSDATVMDLYLKSYSQMIVQNKENDTFAQTQLTEFENTLKNRLTGDELETLRSLKKEVLILEKQLNDLSEKKESNKSNVKEPGREAPTLRADDTPREVPQGGGSRN